MDNGIFNSKEDLDKYYKRCNVLKNLINKEYKNKNFGFIINRETLYMEVVINIKSTITLLYDNDWNEIKRHIDKKIRLQKDYTDGVVENCTICFEKIKKSVSCSKCANNWCSECYINIFKHGKGIITCPHCRYTFGSTMSEYQIKLGVYGIRRELGEIGGHEGIDIMNIFDEIHERDEDEDENDENENENENENNEYENNENENNENEKNENENNENEDGNDENENDEIHELYKCNKCKKEFYCDTCEAEYLTRLKYRTHSYSGQFGVDFNSRVLETFHTCND